MPRVHPWVCHHIQEQEQQLCMHAQLLLEAGRSDHAPGPPPCQMHQAAEWCKLACDNGVRLGTHVDMLHQAAVQQVWSARLACLFSCDLCPCRIICHYVAMPMALCGMQNRVGLTSAGSPLYVPFLRCSASESHSLHGG